MGDLDFSGIIGLDASDFVSGADDATSASEDLAATSDETADSLFEIDAAGIAAGAGFAAAGAGAQALLDDQQELRETLGRTSVGMGISSDDARELATSMSSADFAVDDVVGSMDALAQIGVDTEEEMREVALGADNLADATGATATEISEQLAPAIQALDGDLSAITEDADAFTNAVRNTGLEMSDVSSTIERLDFDEVEELGLSAADTAELIGKFGEESGFTGRQLRTNFRQAVEGADGDTEALVEELGLGEEAMEGLADETSAGTESTDEYAAAANESLTTMDELRSTFADLKLNAAELLGPIDAIAPAMMGVGSGMFALSASGVTASAVLSGLGAAAAAVSLPLLAAAGAVGLVGAAFATDFMSIRTTTEEVIDSVMDRVGPLIDLLRDDFIETLDVWRDTFDRVLGFVSDQWDEHGETVMAVVGPIIDFLKTYQEQFVDILVTLGRSLLAILRGDLDALSEIWTGFFDRSLGRWGDFGSDLVDTFVGGIRDRFGIVEGTMDDLTDVAGSFMPSSDADEGEFSRLTDAGAAIPETMGDSALGNADSLETGMVGATSGTLSASGGGGGGVSADAIRQALEGMSLALSGGSIDIDGDVASMQDVTAELRRAGRQSQNRGIR